MLIACPVWSSTCIWQGKIHKSVLALVCIHKVNWFDITVQTHPDLNVIEVISLKQTIGLVWLIHSHVPPARVHPDALCLKPGLVDAVGGADQQGVQRRRGSRPPGPSGRHLPGQQRQQHQQPLPGRLRRPAVAGRALSEKLPERPLGLSLTEGKTDQMPEM